ncbi:MAG TPA: alpha/beta hydrolase [Ktedonobacterales bacterium]|nr:alpha/beta hydrolase [Ktedonobacterales bacterium]
MSEPNETAQTPEPAEGTHPQPLSLRGEGSQDVGREGGAKGGEPHTSASATSSTSGPPSPRTERGSGGEDPQLPARPGTQLTRGRVPTIHYELSYLALNAEAGPRGAIVLLHDLPGGAYVWQGVMPTLAATGRAVYAFDLLGYGESDQPWPADCTVWGHADNLAPAFARLGLSEIVLVGLGVGGGAAQVLATRLYREQVAALALVASYAYGTAYAADWPMTQMEQRHDPDAPRHTTTEQALADLRATLPGAAARSGGLPAAALDAYTSPWNSDHGRELLFQHIRQMVPNYTNSVASDLKRLTIPVALLWGERDGVTPPALGERLAREIPGARLATIPGAGHLLLDDAPDRVATLLADFAGARRQ